MRKFVVIILSFIMSFSIIGCSIKEEKEEMGCNQKMNEACCKKLRRFDELVVEALSRNGIEAKSKTKVGKDNVVIYVDLKNNIDYTKNQSPEESYILKVISDNFLVFGSVAGLADGLSVDLGDNKPCKIIITTTSEKIEGNIKASANVDELTKLYGKEDLAIKKGIFKVSTITSDNKRLNDLIEVVQKKVG